MIRCPYCSMVYYEESGLKQHLELSLCKQFVPKKEVQTKQTMKSIYICRICAKETSSFKELFDHGQQSHADCLKCMFCARDLPGKLQLLGHFKLHGYKWYCSNHFIAFNTHEELLAHSSTPGHDLECGICFKVFDSKKSRATHKRAHIRSNYKVPVNLELKCPQCPMIYSSKGSLIRHIRTRHKKELIFLCDDCGQEFSTNESLRYHKANVHDTNVDKYQCELCGYTNKQKLDLKRHMIQHYENHCEYCYETFDNVEGLQEHEKAANHQWFCCDKCPGSYRSKSALQAHTLKVHENKEGEASNTPKRRRHNRRNYRVKPLLPLEKQEAKYLKLPSGKYICKICNKEFAYSSGVYKHLDVHAEAPKYKCHCGKSFWQKQNLSAHQSVHSNERPYVCQTCGRSFKENTSFYKHRKHFHGWVPGQGYKKRISKTSHPSSITNDPT